MSQIFAEFVGSLNERNVRYLVIGGWATAFHGHPRFTKDIDVLIDRTDRNATAARDAIYDFFKGRPQDVADVAMLERRARRAAPKAKVPSRPGHGKKRA